MATLRELTDTRIRVAVEEKGAFISQRGCGRALQRVTRSKTVLYRVEVPGLRTGHGVV